MEQCCRTGASGLSSVGSLVTKHLFDGRHGELYFELHRGVSSHHAAV
jgi:hypothetical protein